ncbi:MAG: hypothetical protein JW717_02135 [Marinilabiliaceae bacterium]|nr:hypothetical protein [Marinilabiliaceae bacterium]
MKQNDYKMYPELNFAIVWLQSEKLTSLNLKEINHSYKTNEHYPNIHYLLVIVDKHSKHSFSIKDLPHLSEIYNTEYLPNNHKRIVWMVSQPLITAIAHLFVKQTKDDSKYCSTIQKAYSLLNMQIEYDVFCKLIDYKSSNAISN